jgi:pantothenate synthetase
MTLEQIIALLTVSFTGVRKDGLKQLARTIALQAKTEQEAKSLVEKLTKEQVDEFVKDYRADVDKEVSDGNKTFETNLKKKFDLVEKKDPAPGAGGSDPNDIAAIVKAALAAELNPLKQQLESYKAGDVAKARLQSLTDKLTGCKDETFKTKTLKDFAWMKFETDDEYNEYLSDTEKDIATANQTVADAALGGQGKPLFTQKSETGISQGVADYVASQKLDANVLSGKEV